jgi:hypothetical protein
VLREGETLVVLLPPYFTPAQVQEYHRRVSLMMDLYDMKNQFMVLVGDGLVVAERYNLLEQFVTSDEIRDDESGQLIGYKEKEREQDQESGPEGQPDQGGGPLVAGPPAEEAGPEAPGEVPGGELPEVPDAEPEPVGDGEGRGTEGSDPDQSEDVAAAAAGGEEAKSEEADGGTVPDRSSRRAKRS